MVKSDVTIFVVLIVNGNILTQENPWEKGMKELVNSVFMCIFACRFDVSVLVNIFHLWKLIIRCPGCDDNNGGGDDVDNNDLKKWHFCDPQYVCLYLLSLLNG